MSENRTVSIGHAGNAVLDSAEETVGRVASEIAKGVLLGAGHSATPSQLT
jgi:ribosomal protein L13